MYLAKVKLAFLKKMYYVFLKKHNSWQEIYFNVNSAKCHVKHNLHNFHVIQLIFFSVEMNITKSALSVLNKPLECFSLPLIIGRHSFGRSDFSINSALIHSPYPTLQFIYSTPSGTNLWPLLLCALTLSALWHLKNVIVWYGNQALLVSPVNEVLWNSGDGTHPPISLTLYELRTRV